MAFIEIEDRIERAEVVLFPEVWRRSEPLIEKGALIALRAKVQRQDEGYKLLADEVVPLESHAIAALTKRAAHRRRSTETRGGQASQSHMGGEQPSGRSTNQREAANLQRGAAAAADMNRDTGSMSADRSSSAARLRNTAQGGGTEALASRTSGRAPQRQRVYIKITADHERPDLLQQLKELLKSQPGPLPTVLFYEREQQLRALSEAYSLKPSPELFKRIESMFGAGTVRVK